MPVRCRGRTLVCRVGGAVGVRASRWRRLLSPYSARTEDASDGAGEHLPLLAVLLQRLAPGRGEPVRPPAPAVDDLPGSADVAGVLESAQRRIHAAGVER